MKLQFYSYSATSMDEKYWRIDIWFMEYLT